MARVFTLVAKRCAVPLANIRHPSRAKAFSEPRAIAIAVLHRHGYSYPWIARQVGLRDHSTVLCADRKAQRVPWMREIADEVYRAVYGYQEGAAEAA